MKRLILILVVLLLCVGCSVQNNNVRPAMDNEIYSETDNDDEKIDSNGVIKQDYALEILSKKSAREELIEEEQQYIKYYSMQDERGIAILDLHGIGMHKVTAQLYITDDSGVTWKWADEMWLSSGKTDFEFDGNKLKIINYSIVTGETDESFVLFEDIN